MSSSTAAPWAEPEAAEKIEASPAASTALGSVGGSKIENIWRSVFDHVAQSTVAGEAVSTGHAPHAVRPTLTVRDSPITGPRECEG